jgi:hypothetical protein
VELPQLVELVEEDPYYFVEVEDGRIMEVGSDGELRTPTVSLVVSNPPSPPVVPALVLAAASGEPDDFGDGSDDEDEEDEDDDNAKEYYYDRPREGDPTCRIHSSDLEPDYFPYLLQGVLLELGNSVRPMYVTHS